MGRRTLRSIRRSKTKDQSVRYVSITNSAVRTVADLNLQRMADETSSVAKGLYENSYIIGHSIGSSKVIERDSSQMKHVARNSLGTMEYLPNAVLVSGSNNNAPIEHTSACIPEQNICNCSSSSSSTQKRCSVTKFNQKTVHCSRAGRANKSRSLSKRSATRSSASNRKEKSKLHVLDSTRNNTDPQPDTNKSLQESSNSDNDSLSPLPKRRAVEFDYSGLFSSDQLANSKIPCWVRSILRGVSTMSRYLIRSHIALPLSAASISELDADKTGTRASTSNVDLTSVPRVEHLYRNPETVQKLTATIESKSIVDGTKNTVGKSSVCSVPTHLSELSSASAASHSKAPLVPTLAPASPKVTLHKFRFINSDWLKSSQPLGAVRQQASNLSDSRPMHLDYI